MPHIVKQQKSINYEELIKLLCQFEDISDIIILKQFYHDKLNLISEKENILLQKSKSLPKTKSRDVNKCIINDLESLRIELNNFVWKSALEIHLNQVKDKKNLKGKKFKLKAKLVLKDWYISHSSNPYPTAEDKKMLANNAGITEKQVADWFANERRKDKKKIF